MSVAKDFQAKAQQEMLQIRQLPRDEQQAKGYEKMAALQKQAQADVEKELEPKQVAQIKLLHFRLRAGEILSDPRASERIGVSEDQRRKIDSVRKELEAKVLKLQQGAIEDALKLLTPEQLDKVKQQVNEQPF